MKGKMGENVAADYLARNGYKILMRNYRCRLGEIDIVAERQGTIIFVEVKTRSSTNFGFPAEAVTQRKQQKIIHAALCYLRSTGRDNISFRFDILEVFVGKDQKLECNHIVNAFFGR
nr:YraN family protein [Sporolituus thermophilus]